LQYNKNLGNSDATKLWQWRKNHNDVAKT
jgi:hypothetical protein